VNWQILLSRRCREILSHIVHTHTFIAAAGEYNFYGVWEEVNLSFTFARLSTLAQTKFSR
jgi:hypothetical protein